MPDCEVLDEARGCWSRLPPMAAARSVFAAAALEGEIYVCGGQGEDGEATASCEKFSPKLGRCVSTLSTGCPAKLFTLGYLLFCRLLVMQNANVRMFF